MQLFSKVGFAICNASFLTFFTFFLYLDYQSSLDEIVYHPVEICFIAGDSQQVHPSSFAFCSIYLFKVLQDSIRNRWKQARSGLVYGTAQSDSINTSYKLKQSLVSLCDSLVVEQELRGDSCHNQRDH